MAFEIYVPEALTFSDYIAVIQCARVWADGYDRKDKLRLRAALADEVDVDYTCVNPPWGVKHYTADAFTELWLSTEHLGLQALATQHFLGQPYFISVTATEIVVEWQQIACHGRKVFGEDYSSPLCKIGNQSDGHSFMRHRFVKTDRGWRIAAIRPEVLYATGNFTEIRAQDPK